MRRFAVVMGVLAFGLACGGGGGRRGAGDDEGAPPANEHPNGAVAFKTFSGSAGTIEFSSDTKCAYWWSNIAYDAPTCTYTHSGDEIVLTFNKSGWDGRTMKLRQIDVCSMAQTYIDYTDGSSDDGLFMCEQTKPKCKL